MKSDSNKFSIGAGVITLIAAILCTLVFFGKLGGPAVQGESMYIIGFIKSIIKGDIVFAELVHYPTYLIEEMLRCMVSLSSLIGAITLFVVAIKAFVGKGAKGVKKVKLLGGLTSLCTMLPVFIIALSLIGGGTPNFSTILGFLKLALVNAGYLILLICSIVLGIIARVIKKHLD